MMISFISCSYDFFLFVPFLAICTSFLLMRVKRLEGRRPCSEPHRERAAAKGSPPGPPHPRQRESDEAEQDSRAQQRVSASSSLGNELNFSLGL